MYYLHALYKITILKKSKLEAAVIEKNGYLCNSLKAPVPIDIGIPMMIHSLTPACDHHVQCVQ